MLSIEDRIAIQQLYARYCACMDTGDMQGWAHCFTEDGVFETFTNHRGRDNIAAYGADVMARRQTNAWTNGQHWNNNIIVEGDRDAARQSGRPCTARGSGITWQALTALLRRKSWTRQRSRSTGPRAEPTA